MTGVRGTLEFYLLNFYVPFLLLNCIENARSPSLPIATHKEALWGAALKDGHRAGRERRISTFIAVHAVVGSEDFEPQFSREHLTNCEPSSFLLAANRSTARELGALQTTG